MAAIIWVCSWGSRVTKKKSPPDMVEVTSNTTGKKRLVHLQSFTDIHIGEVGGGSIVRIQELKASIKQGCLHKCSAFQSKSQLCGQLYCLGDMQNNACSFVSPNKLQYVSFRIIHPLGHEITCDAI